MAFTTTWTFNTTFEGFDFTETLVHGVGSATRTHVAGAVRITIVIPSAASDKEVLGTSRSSDLSGIYPIIEAGDQIELDVSAVSDAVAYRTIIRAIYTDASQDQTLITSTPANTLTVALDAGKTLQYIEFVGANKSSLGINHYRDFEEIRLITQTEVGDPFGFLKTTTSFSMADISKDGLYIYLAALDNSGFPVLIKILSALTQDGSIVFAPNAGAKIGVQTARFSADHIFVAGQFDGANTVEKSEDAGASFSVIDDGTFGTIGAFDIGPDSDNRIILFDSDNGDIIQSVDGGTTWTTINASVTPLINSIARYRHNPEEIVTGNQGGATDSINYSPNTGVDLEDYQTGVYPNASATRVITS